MKTAKEMFEELGLEQVVGNNVVYHTNNNTHIDFKDGDFNYHHYANEETDEFHLTDLLHLHKAIHQQMIELGWIEE